MLADERDMFFYLADSLNWCGAEIYLGMWPGLFPDAAVH